MFFKITYKMDVIFIQKQNVFSNISKEYVAKIGFELEIVLSLK